MLENITINQQSSIRIAGTKILYFDPFGITKGSHDADLIFITHDHYDHFEPKSIAEIAKKDTKLAAPESMRKKILSEAGILAANCIFAEPGQKITVDSLQVETVPAYNKTKPFHTKEEKWLGYIVVLDDVRYYVAGDTDAVDEMEKIKCDVAFLPIGGTYTMDGKQAAECIAHMKPKAVIPTHYGSIVGEKTDGADFEKYLKALDADIMVGLKL